MIRISISDAKAQLLELVRRVELGEEVVLTRRNRDVARIVALSPDAETRRSALEEARGAAKQSSGPSAERSQDFLYDDTGMPG